MSNGTSKPRRAMQLGGAFIAIAGLVAGLTAFASAQTTDSRLYSGVITGPDFCTNRSLGGPVTYAFDSDGDGVADVCSLPRSRRETAARQNAMERLGGELALYFGNLFADECTKVLETFGEPDAEATDECAAPRAAAADGRALSAVPQAPIPLENDSDRFFSGPVITSRVFCLNRSFGGPVTYPFDSDGDGVADICSLPRTRRAAVARQNAFERLAAEQGPYFNLLVAEECLRVPGSFGEPGAEAEDVCAVGQPTPTETATGVPLPTPGGTTTPSQQPITPPSAPVATNPGTYNKRSAQNLELDPSDKQIVVTWDEVTGDDDTEDQDPDPYDADEVYEYDVWWTPKGQSWSSSRKATTDGADDREHTITGLANYVTYNIRVQAIRSTGSNPFTPTLSSTPGLAGPPVWPIDTDTDDPDASDPLYSPFYGQISATWEDPNGASDDGIAYYIIQWSTNRNSWSTTRQATIPEADDNTYTIMGLSNGTHYVRVQAVSTNGPGTYSLTESLRLAGTKPSPGQPTELALNTSASTTLTATWQMPDQTDPTRQPTHYSVQWRNLSTQESYSASARQMTVAAPALTAAIPNLRSGDQYEVRVQAINQDIAGSWSSTERIVLGEAAPPANIQLDPGRYTIAISWDSVTSIPAVTSYVLQWDTSSGFANNCVTDPSCNQATPGSSDIEYTIGDNDDVSNRLLSDQVYYVRMRSVNDGPGAWSAVVSVRTGTLRAPSVTLVQHEGESTDIDSIRELRVTWSTADESDFGNKPPLSGFKIQWRSGTQNWHTSRQASLTLSNTLLTDNTGGSYSYTLKNLTTGIPHEVRVSSTNGYGDGPWSVVDSTSTATPGEDFVPSSVEMSAATETLSNSDTRQTAQIGWTLPASSLTVNSYTVQWRSCGTTGYSCGSYRNTRTTSDGDATNYVIPVTSLTDGLHYQARVRANGTSANGGNSQYVESEQVYLVAIDDMGTSDRTDDTVTVTQLP